MNHQPPSNKVATPKDETQENLLRQPFRLYDNRLWRDVRAQRQLLRTYLSGLFTSKYGDQFLMHYVCPLCGEQVNVTKKLNMKATEITIDFQKEVAGRMTNDLRTALVTHYRDECGSERARKELTGAILLNKLKDGVYE